MKTLYIYVGKQLTHFFMAKNLGIYVEKMFCAKNCVCAKNCLHIQFTQLLSLHVFTMGEALIDLVHQYPALWDKQDAMYKDSNYKEAKWKEIAKILHHTKEDVINKWKSLGDTYVRHKNIKSKKWGWFKSMQTKVEVL